MTTTEAVRWCAHHWCWGLLRYVILSAHCAWLRVRRHDEAPVSMSKAFAAPTSEEAASIRQALADRPKIKRVKEHPTDFAHLAVCDPMADRVISAARLPGFTCPRAFMRDR